MKKGKKFLKSIAVLGASILVLMGATGCSNALKDAQQTMNDVGLNALQTSEVVQMQTDANFTQYEFSAADFVEDGANYIIDVSGFATDTNDVKAYTNMEYKVEKSMFGDVDAEESAEVINAIAKVVAEYEMISFDYAPMKSLTEFNNSVNKSVDIPLDGNWHVSTGLTYAVDDIQFNEAEGYVTFSTRQNMKYYQTKNEMTYTVVSYGKDGPKMGWRLMPKTYYERFNQGHQIYIKASPEEIAAMKQDKSLIFTKFVELVKLDKKTDYTVKAGNIQQGKVFDDGSEYSL